MLGSDRGAPPAPPTADIHRSRIWQQYSGLSTSYDSAANSSSTKKDLQKGDVVFRKGERCIIVKIDFECDPPSYIIRRPDGTEVGTERSRLELRDSDSSNIIGKSLLTTGAATGGLLGSATLSTHATPQVTPPDPPRSFTVAVMAPPLSIPQRSLCVGSVQIPALGMTKHQNGVRFFTVQVFPDNGGSPWQILRRYNQFFTLTKQLNDGVRRPFPKKHLFGCEGSKLERRRRGLETWLSAVVAASQSSKIKEPWISVLRQFLEVGLQDASLASSAPSSAASQLPNSSLPRHRPIF